MGAVFVSYRRGDSEGQARALSLELVRLLGRDSVFIDVDSIALGRDFRQVLQNRLDSCDLLLALIGPGWLDATDRAGRRRLEDPNDFVRQEIAAALKRDIPVIPVLVQGAGVPPPESLPDDLKDLSYRHGFELGHSTWESDIREMASRLGLQPTGREHRDPPLAPVTADGPTRERPRAEPGDRRRIPTEAVVALVATIVGVIAYVYATRDTGPMAQMNAPSGSVTQAAAPGSGPTETTLPTAGTTTTPIPPVPSPAAGKGLTGSGIEFTWPGNDCWDIFRGPELVTYQCGTAAQALGPGSYTIKGRQYAVFEPFDVQVTAGSPTRISRGGLFQFDWPGKDCWDVFRGEELVTYGCGKGTQALGAGRYAIKGKTYPVFSPFDITIEDGSATRVVKGGFFQFNWPGPDCWDIFRGTELVIYQCGTARQTLGAGTYTVRGKGSAVFEPFDITIRDGGIVTRP